MAVPFQPFPLQPRTTGLPLQKKKQRHLNKQVPLLIFGSTECATKHLNNN